jgi:hypothetical protein
MKTRLCLLLFCLTLIAAFAQPAWGEGGDAGAKKLPRKLLGTPVNPNLAPAGTVPKGAFVANAYVAVSDKNRTKKNSHTDILSTLYVLKLRYGITDRFEFTLGTPYPNNARSGRYVGPKHIEGPGDENFMLSYAPMLERQGDDFTSSFGLGGSVPTAPRGGNHLPGMGVWGWRMNATLGKWFVKRLKTDTEVEWSGPFERGNKKVKYGQTLQWNSQVRYLFRSFDIGLESNLYHQESGDMRTRFGKRDLRNGYTEWMVGPSMNIAPDILGGVTIGVGVFFPAARQVRGPAAVEDARYVLKIGKFW